MNGKNIRTKAAKDTASQLPDIPSIVAPKYA